MAIGSIGKARSIPSHGRKLRRQMTIDEFKNWLKTFDANKDGRISRNELREAIRSSGAWFCAWKSGRGMNQADVNGDGYIDDDEIEQLVDFAEESMGVKFS